MKEMKNTMTNGRNWVLVLPSIQKNEW